MSSKTFSTGQPATGQPATGQPATGQPATGQPATGQPSSHAGDVVAGLVNNVFAGAVGAAAVREAAARGARIRFLQVLPSGMSADDHASAASVLFKVALKSLHQHQRMPCTFETVVGNAREMLVERSRGAALLVVGADAPDAEVRVADYCQQHCGCDVLVVTEPLQSVFVTDVVTAR